MNLDMTKWKTFFLGDLFPEMYKTYVYNREDLMTSRKKSDHTIRYITRTNENNACEFLANADEIGVIENGNAITIGDTTATCFYQAEPFISGDHIVVLRSEWLNELRGLFVVTLIKQEKFKYSYGRAFIKKKIFSTTIPLPIVMENGEPVLDDTYTYSRDGYIPDWILVEQYIKRLRIKPPTTTIKQNEIKELNTENWTFFELGKLFQIQKGKRLTKADMIDGEDNYLGAIDNNNGIRQKIRAEKLWNANCITVNYNGSVGEAFYQSEPFWASDDVNVFYPRGWEMNKYIGLFIATVIKAERPKYNYGRKWTKKIMEKSLIKLPAKDGNPDFEFMENYMRTLPYGDRI